MYEKLEMCVNIMRTAMYMSYVSVPITESLNVLQLLTHNMLY